jgi:hypothetical protein
MLVDMHRIKILFFNIPEKIIFSLTSILSSCVECFGRDESINS